MLALLSSVPSFQLSAAARPSPAPRIVMADTLDNVVIDKPLTPLRTQVLVKLAKADDTTDGGLFLPDTATEKPKEGVVVATGPGGMHRLTGAAIPNPLAPGDVVLLAEGAGEEVVFNEEKHIFCDALADVLGKFEGGVLELASFQPAGDRILVKGADAVTETSTGIALALDSDPNENQGEVLAVGTGKVSSEGGVLPVNVAVGDQLLYAEGAGSEARIEEKVYTVVSSSECLAKW